MFFLWKKIIPILRIYSISSIDYQFVDFFQCHCHRVEIGFMSNMDEAEVSMQNAESASVDDVILITETVAAPISQRRRSERISNIHVGRNDPIEAHSSSQIGQVRVNQNARNNSTVSQIPKEKRRKRRKNGASNWNVEPVTSLPTNSSRNKKRRKVGRGQNKENGPPGVKQKPS